MGRKIPGRKHHGVRDPDKQNRQRLALIKDKVNAPPANSDDQQVPKSLTRLIELKNEARTKAVRTRKRAAPVFQQKPGESDERFMHRVSRVCHGVLQEAKFEEKYGVNVRRDALTGEVEVVKRARDEIEEYHRKVRKELRDKGKKKRKKCGEEAKEKLTKSQKRSAKLKAKKEKVRSLRVDEFKGYTDTVRFGDVAHAPPNLVAPRKAKNNEEIQRPGKRDLLLKGLIEGKSDNSKGSDRKKTIDKSGKRKDLPAALRRQLEKQQQEVIHAYKLLKAKKYVK